MNKKNETLQIEIEKLLRDFSTKVNKLISKENRGTAHITYTDTETGYYIIFKGDNGEVIGGANGQTYSQKHNVFDVLKDYYPGFDVVDETLKK